MRIFRRGEIREDSAWLRPLEGDIEEDRAKRVTKKTSEAGREGLSQMETQHGQATRGKVNKPVACQCGPATST